MARDHIDDKELKHDAFQDWAFRAIGYVHRHRRWFILGATALVVLVAAAVGGYQYLRYQERHMALAFNEAEAVFRNQGMEPGERRRQAREAFRGFVESYPDAALAPYAWFYLAAIAQEADEPAAAREAYREALSAGGASAPLRAIARTGLARVQEDAQGVQAAEQLYRELPGEPYGDLKAYHLARLAAARNDLGEAHRHLQTIRERYPDSPLVPLARRALSFYPEGDRGAAGSGGEPGE